MHRQYRNLPIDDSDKPRFGHARQPLKTRQRMAIGGGTVCPELNFTLPSVLVKQSTMPQVVEQYRQIITGAVKCAIELGDAGIGC